jgi:hypothetical protein
MLILHGISGFPSTCTSTGSGFFHPGFSTVARLAMTSRYGLLPNIFISELKVICAIECLRMNNNKSGGCRGGSNSGCYN